MDLQVTDVFLWGSVSGVDAAQVNIEAAVRMMRSISK